MITHLPPAHGYRVSLKRGMVGHEIYALQVLLNQLTTGPSVMVEDGVFGPLTEKKVIGLQKTENLVTDGIAGTLTQRALLIRGCKKVEHVEQIPDGLAKGIMEGESGFAVGAVNWDVPGGVDCGPIQLRVYTDQFGDEDVWRRAFGYDGIAWSMAALADQKAKFHGMAGAKTTKSAWRLAILNHNWPSAAANYAKGLTDWTYFAKWYPGGPIDDGQTVSTARDYEVRRYTMRTKAQWVIKASAGRILTGESWANHYVDSKVTYVKSWS